jgi:hypothetical protein
MTFHDSGSILEKVSSVIFSNYQSVAGIEPLTSGLAVECSTNCAIAVDQIRKKLGKLVKD